MGLKGMLKLLDTYNTHFQSVFSSLRYKCNSSNMSYCYSSAVSSKLVKQNIQSAPSNLSLYLGYLCLQSAVNIQLSCELYSISYYHHQDKRHSIKFINQPQICGRANKGIYALKSGCAVTFFVQNTFLSWSLLTGESKLYGGVLQIQLRSQECRSYNPKWQC